MLAWGCEVVGNGQAIEGWRPVPDSVSVGNESNSWLPSCQVGHSLTPAGGAEVTGGPEGSGDLDS